MRVGLIQYFLYHLVWKKRGGYDLMHIVQMTSSRVRLGQSFKTVGYGSASCWGDVGAGSVEAET